MKGFAMKNEEYNRDMEDFIASLRIDPKMQKPALSADLRISKRSERSGNLGFENSFEVRPNQSKGKKCFTGSKGVISRGVIWR
ncbi:MAG: hypothetical protein LBD29_01120 [Treponema sp.]|nr:hypothetical protein [Treponema sp.]